MQLSCGVESTTKEFVTLSHGAGGKEMRDLIKGLGLSFRGDWQNVDDDSATLDLGDGRLLVFTSDSFTVDPLFFPGGNIGHLAVAGTLNDLVVMGADPLGISLSLIIEEGLEISTLHTIMHTMKELTQKMHVPIVTGDTKVMQRGKLDKLIINTSGVGLVKKNQLLNKTPVIGDVIVLSGGLGEHAVALLSKRFNYETKIISDSKPLIHELAAVRDMLKIAKDPTRGGIASTMNELCEKFKIGIQLEEEQIPAKPEVKSVVSLLGLSLYELACEGRFVGICDQRHAAAVVNELKIYNSDAAIVGEIVSGNKVTVNTLLGKRILPMPTGRIVPRIC